MLKKIMDKLDARDGEQSNREIAASLEDFHLPMETEGDVEHVEELLRDKTKRTAMVNIDYSALSYSLRRSSFH